MKKIATVQLRSQLRHFGLNPQDWVLKKIGPEKFAIRHHSDHQTYFLGLVTLINSNWEWRNLQVKI